MIGGTMRYEIQLAKEAHKELVNHPDNFKIWFWGAACVGNKFSIIMDTLRSSPTIQMHIDQDERTPEEVKESQRCIEVEVPYWWRRKIVKAAKSVVARAALLRMQEP